MSLLTLGAIAKGISEGAQRAGENMRAAKKDEYLEQQAEREKTREARDAKRFEYEEKTAARQQKLAEDEDAILAKLQQVDIDAHTGQGDFAQAGFVGQPKQAIAPNGQPTTEPMNPLMVPGDGKYQNQKLADQIRTERKAQLMEQLYTLRREPEKAMMVREQMAELAEKQVDRKLKTALAAFALGAPGSVQALSNVYGFVSDGKSIDPSSGTFDPKTKTWSGITFIDDKTGEKTVRDITQEDIIGLAKRDAAAIALFNVEQAWKQKSAALEERKTVATEKGADAQMINARANAAEAAGKVERYKAISAAERDAQKGSDIKARVESLSKLFPLAGKEFKLEDMLGKEPKDIEKLAKQKDADEKMLTMAGYLAGLNPTANPQTLALLARQQFTRGGIANTQTDKDGSVFVNVGGQKIILK